VLYREPKLLKRIRFRERRGHNCGFSALP